MERLDEVLQKISNFVAPIATTLTPEDTPSDWLNNLLNEKLQSLKIDDSKAEDIKWTYVEQSLDLLKDLKEVLKEDSLISVNHQLQISSLIQFIIALGMLPSLLPGVGLPIEKRSKFYELVLVETDKKPPILELHNRLVYCTKTLLDLSSNSSLNQIIFTKHLGDVLAALLQLSSAPLKKPSDGSKDDFHLTKEKYEELINQQADFKNDLQKVIDKVYTPLIVKYLLVLQSCGASQALNPIPKSINVKKFAAPKWIRSTCGALLTHCLTKSGVLQVIQGILDVNNEGQDAQKHLIIATVISNPPSTGKYADLENYFQLICPQILDILDKEDNSKVYHSIACHCIRSLTERSLILSRRYLLGPLLNPLTRLLEYSDQEVILEEQELDECIKKLHLCFVVINDPSLMFINHLQPIIMILLELHCRINFGVSHLRKSVEEIVQKFLRWSSKSVSLATLRAYALGDYENKDDSRFMFKPMLDCYAFVAAENGGIKAIGKEYKKAEESSFYVADDEKAICLDDLAKENEDKSLAVEFFLSLLADLSDIMMEENDMNGPDLEVKSDSKEKELLKLEQDLDWTMNSLRRRIMVIRLLGLMSEDDKLQEELLKNPTRLITFLALTFQRCATLCKIRQENKEDYDYGMAEIKSLQTALTLLTHLVIQPEVPMDHWEALKGTLDDLKVLSEMHEQKDIQSSATKLHKIIKVNVEVLNHQNDMKNKAKDIVEKTKEARAKMEEIKLLNEKATKEQLEKETFKDCLDHLEDKEIPIRGHGLIALTNLVAKKDEETLENMEQVFKIFTDNLSDPDTYIYLQAIKGLSTCSFHNPDLVINRLCREYAILDDSKYPGEKGIELRTKIGEALVNVTKILGDLTPMHKNKLLNPFLAQINHPDPLIRASSLSNLGEVCKNLRFSLGSIVNEVFSALHEVIQFDKAIEVRRAGIFVIKLLLEGLGSDAFSVLQNVIRDIWRTLIAQRNSEADEIMQVHIHHCIEEINKIVKQFLTPSNNLQKTIYVLDQPPEPF